MLDFGREFDVCTERHAFAVECFGGQITERCQALLKMMELLLGMLIFGQSVLIGIANDDSAIAVNNHGVAARNISEKPADSDDCRDLERTGENRRMTGSSTLFRRECVH